MSAGTDPVLGVGLVGAGPVTQAIHLPTLATLSESLKPVHVMDVDPTMAEAVASRAGARSSTTLEALLDDDAVDVVAICSPHQFHADQVEAVVAAGKRAILCEKPLATAVADAQRIADASATSGIPVVVGAMHAYDPAWRAASSSWADLGETPRFVRSAIYLPGNAEFEDLATTVVRAPGAKPPGSGPAPAPAAMMRGAVLGLVTHTVPQIRQFAKTVDSVQVAATHLPFGYRVVLEGSGCTVEIAALLLGRWAPSWTFEAWGQDHSLSVQFPPSYVQAGSASATLTAPGSRQVWRFPINGYQAEWMHVADVARGRAELIIPVQTAVDDLEFALELADQAAALLEDQSSHTSQESA
jgi:myo-inositol 2-dehydrogenase / D-chiro-inositol 1-dehydrogenase